jgi:hypothetical protein
MTMTQVQLPEPLYEGNAVTVGVTFANPEYGVPPSQWSPVDPTTVSLTYIAGTGADPVTWVYGVDDITGLSTGVYIAELDTTSASGRWRVKWVGTDACAAVWIRGFQVLSQPF